MKILLLSDSHGKVQKVMQAIEVENADYSIFLGDGLRDFEGLSDDIIKVQGNCDSLYSFDLPFTTIKDFGGHRFLLTHGHLFKAKWGVGGLIMEAKASKCDCVCFGHTHTPLNITEDGVTLINPGSIANGDYAIININNGKIVVENKTL